MRAFDEARVLKGWVGILDALDRDRMPQVVVEVVGVSEGIDAAIDQSLLDMICTVGSDAR